ncbi:MAG: DUF3021 domain-containing protein [Ruminococcus sp.]|nr:DUF3021 domain-containing protein [Ruminococcus sp.]
MKKKVISRCLIGAPIGLFVCHLILIIISVFINLFTLRKGEFFSAPPSLITLCGNELNAVIIQTICSLIMGAAFAGASVIWEVENWSLLKQTILHFLVISVSTLPIAYCMYLIPHTFRGILIYIAIFFFIYFTIWIGRYFTMKKKIQAINDKIKSDSVNKK